MASVPPSRRGASILTYLEDYESSSDSESERSSDYLTAPDSTDYDDGTNIDELITAMSQVTTEEIEPGRLGMV